MVDADLKRQVLFFVREQFEDGNENVDIEELVEYFECDTQSMAEVLKELEADGKVCILDYSGMVCAIGGSFVWED